MLRDRYPAVDRWALVPALTLEYEPVLARLDRLLDDDVLFQAVKADLARRRPHPLETGRPSTPVAVLLRLLIVRRLYGGSYSETEHFVGDSLVLRQVCRLGLARVPDDTPLLRWAALLQPVTLDRLRDHVVALARQLKVTRGRKLRLDSTVVQTPLHYPTASGLLLASVRTPGRLIRRARPAVAPRLAGVRDAFRPRTRRARRPVQQSHRATRQKGAAAVAAQEAADERLCRVARQVGRPAERVQHARAAVGGGEPGPESIHRELARVLPLAQQVLAQTAGRVLRGEPVPAADKVVSLVEPHPAIIPRHKAGRPVEFGRKLGLAEAEGGIVTAARVLDGAPPDAPEVLPSVARQQRQFGRVPDCLTGDRGCSTATVRRERAALGGRRGALPHTGRPSAASRVRERWFQRSYRGRAGSEGRSGVLQRRFSLARCPDHGEAGGVRWVGWGVLTANLVTIARATTAR